MPSNQYYRYGARWCAPEMTGCPSYGSQTYWWWFNKPVSMLLSDLQMTYYGMP